MCTAVRKASSVLQLIKRNFFKHDKSTLLIIWGPEQGLSWAKIPGLRSLQCLGWHKSGATSVWHKLQDVYCA